MVNIHTETFLRVWDALLFEVVNNVEDSIVVDNIPKETFLRVWDALLFEGSKVC